MPLLTLAASLLLQQAQAPVLPTPTPTSVPNAVRDWGGFKFLAAAGRTTPDAFPASGDWSAIKAAPAADAAVWRTKVVILNRVDRFHEGGRAVVWPGLHAISPFDVARVKRAIPQFQALVAQATAGAVRVVTDVAEEPEILTIQGGDLQAAVARYLEPRINGGTFEAEDKAFRGPYQSVVVIHPVGGESMETFEVQGSPVSLVGVPDVPGQEVDGALALRLFRDWRAAVAARARAAGLMEGANGASLAWPAVLGGGDVTTETRLVALAAGAPPKVEDLPTGLLALAPRGKDTTVEIVRDKERGSVLRMAEVGNYRAGGFALPTVADAPIDVAKTPTLAFWAKSDALDPIVVQINPPPGGTPAKVVRLGADVPFAYDNAWHRVKIDLRPLATVGRILIASDAAAKATAKLTLGPIVALFSDFEATAEEPDAPPAPEPPSATATSAEARAAWAATAEPGDERRALMKDRSRAVIANAVAAALTKPDPLDEPLLIESALYTFDSATYTPALRALGKLGTPTAREALERAVRAAAAERARGVAAEVLAETGEPKYVSQFLGLNQAKARAARLSAIRAFGRLPGDQAAQMRMAFLPQDDPEIKLAATLTADANDDYQGRKLLWSAVNEPSDAVRLESLRRLAASSVALFRDEGLKGVRDDSVGVRVGLLRSWTAEPNPAYVPAVRLALGDASPRVRAAALDALAASGEAVEAKELPLEDADPRVQLALLRLAKAKGLPLPAEARERMRKSPDPQVRALAGTE